MESVVKVQRAALRAPRGQMPTACPRDPLVNKVRCASLGGGPQAMSMCIVEGRQQRPGPPTAACGGNGGRARWARGLAAAAPEARYRGPGSAATRRELSRAIIAVLKYWYETCGYITHAQPHGSCWALPSSAWRRLHGPECWALPSSAWRRLPGPEFAPCVPRRAGTTNRSGYPMGPRLTS